MAKRKTPKADKIVDLKPKAEKITDEELERMQSLVSNINKIQLELGSLQSRNHELLHVHANVDSKITEFQKELEEKYGTADIGIQDGSINYKENGASN